MADGFMGNGANDFFQRVKDGRAEAGRQLGAVGGGKLDEGGLGALEGRGYRTGVGTSQNIVVDEGIYESAVSQLTKWDREAAERIHEVLVQIKELCQTQFIAPETAAGILVMAEGLKESLSEFQGVTEEVAGAARRYVGEMVAADR